MEEVVVESWNLPPQPLKSPSWKEKIQSWKEEANQWKKEKTASSPTCRRREKKEPSPCSLKRWEELSPRWKSFQKPILEEVEVDIEGEETWKEWKEKNSDKPCWKGKTLKDRLEAEKSCYFSKVSCAQEGERLPQSCISKPYLNLAEALLLDQSVLSNAEILTSPSSLFIDISKLVKHFPNLKAAYNIFIKVRECDAEQVRNLKLEYGLFLLDPNASELTLTALLPHLHPKGCYSFFYGKGMIVINEGVAVVRGTQFPENLTKMVRNPKEYPCKEGSWYNEKAWKVMAVELNKEHCTGLEKLSGEGSVVLEHVTVHNKSNMIYINHCLRQMIEALVLSMNCVKIPTLVLSGIASVTLIEAIFYIYAQQNNLMLENCSFRSDLLISAWAGEELCGTITKQQLRKFILKNKACSNCCVDLMLRDPLLILDSKEEQEIFSFGKPFSLEGQYKPKLLMERS